MGAASVDHKYIERLALALGPSAMAARAIVAMVAATLALLAVMPGATGPRILAATWVLCAGMEAMQRIALRRGAAAIRALTVSTAGDIELVTAAGRIHSGALRDGSFVAPWLTVLHWRAPGARLDRTLLILPDMLPAADFRRLRVLLRWR